MHRIARRAVPLALAVVSAVSAGFAAPAIGTAGAAGSGTFVPPLTFGAYQNYPVGSWPQSVAVGDFTGDGRNDVVLSTSYYFDAQNDFKMFLFVQQPDGSLAKQARYDTTGAYGNSMGLATGDFNGDGRADVALATAAGVDVFLQQVGGLGPYKLLNAPTGATQVEVADVNHDGHDDLVVNGSGYVSLLTGLGDGTFASPVAIAPSQPEIEVADVTGDGLLDLVGTSGTGVSVWPQQPDGSFVGPAYYSGPDVPFQGGIGVGDVTGDGRADVVKVAGGNQPGPVVSVFPQSVAGTLGSPIVHASYDGPEPVEVGDVNGDGRGDVVVVHGGWLAAGVYLQQADGSLGGEQLLGLPYASHYNPKGLVLGDVNGDHINDIVVADYNNGLVVVRSGPSGRAWGLNNVGQLGNGTTGSSSVPAGPVGLGAVSEVAAGGAHTLAVRGDGTVAGWGLNNVGQLGDGSSNTALTPTTASGLTGITSVAGGLNHSLARRGDGTVWAWGWNVLGQLGDGTTADRHTPVQVPGLGGVTSVAAGALHSLAVKEDGTVRAWGYNGLGQLGTGGTADSRTPVQVPGLSNVVAVSAGAYNSLALKKDGTVWAWGWNYLGQLGSGSTATALVPQPVPGLTNVVAIAAGYYHGLALKADGTVWAWGLNALGELGTGSTTTTVKPVQVQGLPAARSIAAGAFHSLASTGGGVWAWGWNYYGQLGDGSTVPRLLPVPVSGVGGVVSVSAGIGHSAAAATSSQPYAPAAVTTTADARAKPDRAGEPRVSPATAGAVLVQGAR